MTKREKFAQEQYEREKKPLEEEDHLEEVSFMGTFPYLKATLWVAAVLLTGYKGHHYMKAKQQQRKEKNDGLLPEYDPSDPEMQSKLTEKQRLYLQPGGPWELKDL